MSRQSEIRERLEVVAGAYPDSDNDIRYLLDRLEAAEGLLKRTAKWDAVHRLTSSGRKDRAIPQGVPMNQREKAARKLQARLDENFSRTWKSEAIDLQVAVDEAAELMRDMYHEMGHLMITHEWQQRHTDWLSRNERKEG